MTPLIVSYTGQKFDPQLLNRRFRGPTPVNWTRHQFIVNEFFYEDRSLVEWLTERMSGRWTLNYSSNYTTVGSRIVIGFESESDAVMFRLMDGETAWRKKDLDF